MYPKKLELLWVFCIDSVLTPLLVSIGIFRRHKLDAQRRTLQVKGVTEGVLKIATIAVTDLIDRIAVDDDDRRIGAALVGIARFRPEQAVFWRRLASNGVTQDAGQTRR